MDTLQDLRGIQMSDSFRIYTHTYRYPSSGKLQVESLIEALANFPKQMHVRIDIYRKLDTLQGLKGCLDQYVP